MATKAWLVELVAKSSVLMVTRHACPFCIKAKDYLIKSGFTSEEVHSVEGFDVVNKEDILAACQELTGAKTFPRVWVKGELIGGCDDVITNYMNGSLPKMKYDMILDAAARELVDSSATTAKVVVISKKTCPPCTEVKMMLEEAGFTKEQTNVITISDWPNMDNIQVYCKELTGERWTPRVWIDGKAMGGIKEIKPLFESGKLEEMASE